MADAGDRIEIRLAGFGGQGVVLAGLILGEAAVMAGWFASGSNSYGAQARGSACRADLVLSRGPIDYPHMESSDLLVAMSQGAYDTFAPLMAPGGRLFYDAGLVRGGRWESESGFDVTGVCLRELQSRQPANVYWVGLVAGMTGWFGRREVDIALERYVPSRFLELNRKALSLGWAEAEGRGKGSHGG